MIKKIDAKGEKEKICMEILEALPEWFEVSESRMSYAKDCRELPFWADVESDIARGFIVMKETSKYAVEICVMGVRKEFHHLGIGSKLFEAFYQYAKEQGYEFIQVKTVREGMYPDYDLTNVFYQKAGFRELECMEGLWDAADPCQVYVMSIK
ncbi:MAG: GNAT family N-acetyltransferase [Lachnospiraceae bacterium]|nr:GNAT family N-acetyltransferase [Lachnospiraceae bacterium]